MTRVQESHRSDLRGAWQWGVWIGWILLLVGISAIACALLAEPGTLREQEHLSAPTPESMRASVFEGLWLGVQGVVVAAIGVGLLALSLNRMRRLRVIEAHEQAAWGNSSE